MSSITLLNKIHIFIEKRCNLFVKIYTILQFTEIFNNEILRRDITLSSVNYNYFPVDNFINTNIEGPKKL